MSHRKTRSKNVRLAEADMCEFPFHSVLTVTVSAGGTSNQQFNLTPAGITNSRGTAEADAWSHFRVKKFMFRILPTFADADTNYIAAGYVGGMQDTPPTTYQTMMELLPSVMITGNQTRPSEWVKVRKPDLAGPLPWYKTVPGTADTTEESPGQLCVVGQDTSGGTGSFCFFEVRGVFEFKTAVAIANTPMYKEVLQRLREERIRKADEEERVKLLKVLSPSPLPSNKVVDTKRV